MFIADKVDEDKEAFPQLGKKYINNKVDNNKDSLAELKKYWKSYIETPNKQDLATYSSRNKTDLVFSEIEGLAASMHIDEVLHLEVGAHMLDCFLIQIK
jgi:uncharacterized Ntn-hydrolase superfamily protein